MMIRSLSQLFSQRIVLFCALIFCFNASAFSDAWLDGDPNAIWERSPGVYKENGYWYVIFHAAPGDTNVAIVGDFTNGDAGAVPLTRTPDGYFWWFKGTDDSFASAPQHGDEYRFRLERDGEVLTFQDPAARWVTHSGLVDGMSKIVVTDDYDWQATDWERPTQDYLNIYQLHPLRFTDRNDGTPFEEVIEELDNDGQNDYINELGVSAVQLLPVNEFAGAWSWGYNPSFFYAVESSYGGPDQLKKLVDTAHQNGIAVILDLEFNHVGTGDNILWTVSKDTYIDGDTVWGGLMNFNDPVTKHFLIQNVLYLAKEYKIDGFRFDHTNTIHNDNSWFTTVKGDGGGWQLLREMYGAVKNYDQDIWFTAEELPDWWGITADNIGSSVGGTYHGPMDSQWVDTFHDSFKEVLTGGHLDGLWPVFGHFGDGWQDATVYTESHDEVGNTDDRIARRGRDGKGWEMSQLSLAGTIMARGTPMVFMGQEGGETTQFHIDWWDDRLPLDEYETSRTKVLGWYQLLNSIRGDDFTTLSTGNSWITHINDANGVAAFTRADAKYAVIMNFKGQTWWNYDVGVSGLYEEVANTSWQRFRFGGQEVSRGEGQVFNISSVHIPPYGAVILKRSDEVPNEPPTADAGDDATIFVGETVTFDGSGSFDIDGNVVAWNWDGGLSDVENPSLQFNVAGSYTFNLVVTDDDGATSDIDSVTITVEEEPVGGVEITFNCYNGYTDWGQNIYVVGNIPELGNWDVNQARKLNPTSYPTWSNTFTDIPANTSVRWKCIKRDLGPVVWEPGSDNAFTSPSSGTATTNGNF